MKDQAGLAWYFYFVEYSEGSGKEKSGLKCHHREQCRPPEPDPGQRARAGGEAVRPERRVEPGPHLDRGLVQHPDGTCPRN